jgi:hypothetical protein
MTFPVSGSRVPWVLDEAQVSSWAELYPTLDVLAECRKAKAWLHSSRVAKTGKGMPRFLVNWLNRSVDRAQSHGPPRQTTASTACSHDPPCREPGGFYCKKGGRDTHDENERQKRLHLERTQAPKAGTG